MTGLQIFSVKGLRMFQNMLFGFGFLLLPMVFFMESLITRFLLSFFFISIFWGFVKTERAIAQKHRQKALDTLSDECMKEIKELEGIFYLNGYSIERKENAILDFLYLYFYTSTDLKGYLVLQKGIRKRTTYVLEMISNDKKEEKRSKQAGEELSYVTNDKDNQIIAQSLHVLELPEGTKDIVTIKDAYKKLIKRYHPVLNHSDDAGLKTIALNLAYEQLTNNIEAS